MTTKPPKKKEIKLQRKPTENHPRSSEKDREKVGIELKTEIKIKQMNNLTNYLTCL